MDGSPFVYYGGAWLSMEGKSTDGSKIKVLSHISGQKLDCVSRTSFRSYLLDPCSFSPPPPPFAVFFAFSLLPSPPPPRGKKEEKEEDSKVVERTRMCSASQVAKK